MIMTTLRILKHIVLVAATTLSLMSCGKGNDKEEHIDMSMLTGTWTEWYAPTTFVMEGSIDYTFDGNTNYSLEIYDVFSGKKRTHNGHYAINLFGNNTITITPEMSDHSGVTYKITKLTEKEMSWQKEGTTYSKGTWGSDYRRFVRSR